MADRVCVDSFTDLYSGVERLTLRQQLSEQIRIIRTDEHLELFGKLVCLDLCDHENLDLIPIRKAEQFIERTDIFVTACLNGRQIKQ